LWAEWQRSGHTTPDPQANYTGQFFEANGSPANANSTSAMDIASLDYIYDIFQAAQLPAGGAASRFNTQQIQALDQLLKPGTPETIGSAENANPSRADLETGISVSVTTLPSLAKDFRALAAAGLTLSTRRVLARLSNIAAPDTNDLIVNVFVDCPYLSPTTPYTDPHYAGSFSFFGSSKSMPGMGGPSFVVDITGPVLEAGFAAEKVRVQLMPVSAIPNRESKTSFKVGKIDIVTV
jgi:tyrosinase